jgi:hypothetical protein
VELVNHDPKDRDAPYMASADEGVTCFYYDAPWRESSVLVAWQTGAGQVMDEWQLFTNAGEQADGTVSGCAPSSSYGAGQLLMAHPRGSNDVLMPPRTGLRLPGPGSRLVLQWHYNNNVGVPIPDRSVVRLCTMPTSMVPNVAGLTVLGSENAAQGVPPGRSNVEGSCLLEPADPVVRLLMLAPHMHARGRQVVMRVERANGGVQRVLDLDFDSEAQLMRATNVTLRPGDRLVTSCTYENNGSTVIPFGASVYSEQCYVFAVSQPAGALDRGSGSPFAGNTCL